MRAFLRKLLIMLPLFSVFAGPAGAQDRAAITQRVRAELATLLKKDAAKLPVDTPVLKLGADELDIVEWVMAVEEAFKIEIADEKVSDPKTKETRKDFSIASMATIVMETPRRASARAAGAPPAAANDAPQAIALKTLKTEQVGFVLTAVNPKAKGEFAGECIVMPVPQAPGLLDSELGALIAALKAAGEHPCRMVIAAGKTEVFITPAKLPEVRIVLDASGAGTLTVVKDGTPHQLGLAEHSKK